MAKAKRKGKPKAAVTMKGAIVDCAHAQCERTLDEAGRVTAVSCTAGARAKLTEDDLPRRARWALVDRDAALDALRQFDVATLADLERRAGVAVGRPEEGPGEATRDGYPTSVRRSERGSAARRCNGEDLVGGRVVRCDELAVPGRLGCGRHSSENDEVTELLPGPTYADPAGEYAVAEGTETSTTPEAVRRIHEQLRRAARHARLAAALMRDLKRNPLGARGSSVGICQACEATVTGVGEDRLKYGFCPADAKAWERYRASWDGPGAPDRMAFIASRRERRAS